MRYVLAGATLATMLASSVATAQSVLCRQLEGQIRLAEMNMAAEFAEGVGDNSAPRETTRQLRIGNQWAAVQAHLATMQANSCAPISRAISGSRYIGAALACSTDRLRGQSNPESCKRSTWKADESVIEPAQVGAHSS